MKNIPVILLLGFVIGLIYLPGLPGGFMFDDYPNIVENPNLHLQHLDTDGLLNAAFGGSAGPLKRPLAMLSFALNYWLDGIQPLGYKLVNIGLHIVNSCLVFALAILLLRVFPAPAGGLDEPRIRRMALLAALLWAVHPLNLSTVLFVVQRMTGMVSLFMLLGLVTFCIGRTRMLRGQTGYLRHFVATGLAFLLGLLAKENAVLLLPYLFVCELCIFRFRTATPGQGQSLRAVYILIIGVPALLAVYFSVFDNDWLLGNYAIRPFTLYERVLTEARVLWFYIHMLLLPSLISLGIFHDDIAVSTGLFAPPVTALAIAGLALLAGFGAWACRRGWLVGFALLWFLVGHSLESTILPLELAHEHRNYLPSIGPLFSLAYYLLHPGLKADLRRMLPVLGVFLVLLFAGMTAFRAWEWRNPLNMALMEVYHHPRSQRVQYQLGRMYLLLYKLERQADFLEEARAHFEQAASLDPSTQLALFALIHVDSALDGQARDEVLTQLEQRLREQPFHPTTVVALQNLVQCLGDGFCHMTPPQFLDVVASVLDNPSLSGRDRSDVLIQLSSFYISVVGDGEAAVRVLQDIIHQQPGVWSYRTSLVRVLLSLQRWQEAAQELDAARKMLLEDSGFIERELHERQLEALQLRLDTRVDMLVPH